MPPVVGAMGFLPGVDDLVFLSTESQKRDCPGCCTTDTHMEDLEHTRLLSQFPIDIEALRAERLRRKTQTIEEAVLPLTADSASLQATEEFLVHIVCPSDTLTGIEMRYNVTRDELRKINPQMVGDMFKHLEALRVPRRAAAEKRIKPMGEQKKRGLVLDLFVRRTHCTREEAAFYLDDANWNTDMAVHALEEDREFERRNKRFSPN